MNKKIVTAILTIVLVLMCSTVTSSYNPYYNLAFEEYVFLNCKDDDYLILWQNENTIVYGLNQNPLVEINKEEADKHGINLVRRSTGGGTVYHDLGNLNFSYITDYNNGEKSAYEFFLSPIIDAFKSIGLEIEVKGRNDMVLDGKKISGSAQRLKDGRILHHGTLLINSDLERIQSVLNVSREKIESKGIKSVKSRVTNIQEYVEEPLDVARVKELIINSFKRQSSFQTCDLSQNDLECVTRLADEKYKSWNWLFAKTPEFAFERSRRFEAGSVKINLNVKEGTITDCMITGDFLSLYDVNDIERELKGRRYEKAEIEKILRNFDCKLYFGNIAADEIVELFF